MKTQNDSLLCVCAEDNAKKKAIAKAKRKPLANCLCLSPSTPLLPFSLSLSPFVVSKIAIVIWAKISITASMPCHKRNPIPIAIPIACSRAGRQAYIVAKPGEWHSVLLLPSPSLVLVIESNHLWLPNASEIMKRKPLCGASAARRSCLADNFVEATKLTKQIICENWISMNMNKARQHEREKQGRVRNLCNCCLLAKCLTLRVPPLLFHSLKLQIIWQI